MGTTTPKATGLSANAMNRNKCFAPAPRTCIIRELFDFCEANDILLTKSILDPEAGWIFIPGSATTDVLKLDYKVPGVLFLPDRATRNTQMDAMQRLDSMKASGGAL